MYIYIYIYVYIYIYKAIYSERERETCVLDAPLCSQVFSLEHGIARIPASTRPNSISLLSGSLPVQVAAALENDLTPAAVTKFVESVGQMLGLKAAGGPENRVDGHRC